MLYSLITQLIDQYSFLNVFKYLTFRTGLSMFTSMFVVLLIGTPFIKFFSARKILNPIRDDGPTEHIVKKIGTPTMGGVLILLGLFSGILLWGDLSNYHIWFLLFIVSGFGLLGAYDDYKKIKFKNYFYISTKNNLNQAAKNLYACLRKIKKKDIEARISYLSPIHQFEVIFQLV